LFLYLSIIFAFLSVGETYFIGFLDNWNPDSFRRWIATERISLYLFFIFFTIYIILRESKKTKISKWFSNVGNSSLGILFMMDLVLVTVQYLLWHIPHFILNNNYTAYGSGISPLWLIDYSIYIMPVYFIAGLFVPLLIMKTMRRIWGAKINVIW